MQKETKLSYQADPAGHIWLALLFVLFCVSLWMVVFFWDVSGQRTGWLLELIAPVAAPIYTWLGIHLAVKFRGYPRDLFTVSPEGLHDVRLTKRPIPWDAIEKLALRRRLARMELLVTLKERHDLADFNDTVRRRKSAFFRKKKRSGTLIVGERLNRNPAMIANDLNTYPHLPKRLIVGKA